MSLDDWMDVTRKQARASSFGPAAELYDRIRPDYPDEAVAWALAPLGAGRWQVIDLGAGTGIMTRRLLATGQHVVSVEPDALMRARLAGTTPGADLRAGSAEAIPAADGSVDAVVAAQAYHWFDRERAHAELARVIRPGGVFSAIWNHHDETTPWVQAYSLIVEGDRGPDGSGADSGRAKDPSFGDAFEPVAVREFRHATSHSAESLVALLKSRSYFITATPDRQAELETEVRQLAASHPDLAGRAEFALPYVTLVLRGVRR